MQICYLSEKRLYTAENGNGIPVANTRYDKYKETVRSIQDAKAWKSHGTGAQFTGTAQELQDESRIPAAFSGVSCIGDELIYALCLEEMGGLYAKTPDGAVERHILSRSGSVFGEIDYKNGKLAMSAGNHPRLLHLTVLNLENGSEQEFTDGDSIEASPRWSVNKDVIYCSTAGYARDQYGRIAAIGPHAIAVLNPAAGTFTERYADPALDYLKPADDAAGNFYFIRQPYRSKEDRRNIFKDILLFPVRIVKALFGFLNAFSVLFGGESLHGDASSRAERAKRKSEKELFFEGNQLNAEKNIRENERGGEKYPGIFPRNRELVRIAPDGTETVLKRGVLDYCVCKDGSILCSNGRYILRLQDGTEEKLVQAKLATCLTVLETADAVQA